MGTSPIRATLKRVVPTQAARTLRRSLTYMKRMTAWSRLMLVASGRTPLDAEVLRRSMFRAPRDMLRDLDVWRDPQLVGDADIHVRGLGTFAIRGGSDDLGHAQPYAHASLLGAIRRFVRPGDVAVDAGANIGVVTALLAQEVGPSGRVFSIEMMRDTAARLRRNVELNGLQCVTVIEAALSATAGETVMAEVAEGCFGQASIAAGANPGKAVRRVPVLTTTLDQITADVDAISLIKLDLEGAELQAIAGAEKTLQRTKAVVFESWSGDGGKPAAALGRAGFLVSQIDGRNFLACRA